VLELFYLDLPVVMVENHGDGWITCDSPTETDKKGKPRRAKYFCNQLRWSPFGKRVFYNPFAYGITAYTTKT
jgi:hypothetical protein